MHKFSAQKGIIDPKIIIGGIVALAVIFILATGSFKFSVSPTKESSQTEQTQSTKPETKTYQNSQYGFSLEYPVDWDVKEGQQGYVADFVSPDESAFDKYSEFLGVKVVSLASQPDVTVQQAAEAWEQQTVDATSTDSNLKIVDRKSSTVGGNEAKTIVYTLNINNLPIKGSATITLKNNNGYIFQYYAEREKYDKYLPDIEAILSSVSF